MNDESKKKDNELRFCPNCGEPIVDPKMKFCLYCGADLNEEKTGKSSEAESPKEKKPSLKSEPPKEKKPLLKPETKQKIFNNFAGAGKYVWNTILHPGTANENVSTSASLIVDVFFIFIEFIWLYVVQRGLVHWIASGLPGMPKGIFTIVSTNITFRMSFGYTFLGSLELALGILLIMTIMMIIVNLKRKKNVNLFVCLKSATHFLIIPELLLLISSIIMAFSFGLGVIALAISVIVFFMNIVLMFKDAYDYIAYLTVVIGFTLILLLAYAVFSQCWVLVKGITNGI